MKKQTLVVAMALISAATFGQKKEIKKAEKAIKSGNISEAVSYVNAAEGLIGAADNELKTKFYIVKGEAYLADAGTADFGKLKTAAEAFTKAKGMNPTGEMVGRLDLGTQNLRTALVNSAVNDQNTRNYKSAAEKLYASYSISKKDTADLYYAAGNAINAKDYDSAIKYYQTLLDEGYTGITKQFTATDLATGEEVSFRTENERNTNMLTGQYTNPNTKVTESVRGDILTNMTLIYSAQGKNDEALALMQKARAANPNDISLVRAEADMRYKMGDMEQYNNLMKEVIKSDPTNPELYYNLGVGSAQNGDTEQAMEYYSKAIELNPEYANAHINSAAILLAGEGKIVEEMNNLGTSRADNARYDVLKEERKQLYQKAIPFLEAGSRLKPENIELSRTLMNIYSQVGDDANYKKMKAKIKTMEGGN